MKWPMGERRLTRDESQTLFTLGPDRPIYEHQGPQVRRADPTTSRLAQRRVEPGNVTLMDAIHRCASACKRSRDDYWPLSAFLIAAWVETRFPGRWDEGTIRSAVSRAKFLRHVDDLGVSPSGNPCMRFRLGDTT